MSSVVLSGDSSGTVTLTVPSAAGTNTATLPAATGTVMVSGNMPAFSAYSTSTQTISQSTYTKVAFQATEFDTANAFDKTTNYRFTPNVAGYYQITGNVTFTTGQGTTEAIVSIYKNGSFFKNIIDSLYSSYSYSGTALIYMNGSTDYLELYAYSSNSSTRTINNNSGYTYFQGILIRAA